jgi:TolB-like protein
MGAPTTVARTDGAPLVAVAGFINISGNADDEWLGTGITETLTMEAAQMDSVAVVPRERVCEVLRTLRQQTGEPDERLYVRTARALGAKWMITGGYQRSGDAVRVTASLADVATGEIIRTARVDGAVGALPKRRRVEQDDCALLRRHPPPGGCGIGGGSEAGLSVAEGRWRKLLHSVGRRCRRHSTA